MEEDPAADERRKNKGGLEWELERHYDDLEREMMLMAADRPHKQQRRHRPDLLQNCDLPPPAKLFGPVPTLHRYHTHRLQILSRTSPRDWDCIARPQSDLSVV